MSDELKSRLTWNQTSPESRSYWKSPETWCRRASLYAIAIIITACVAAGCAVTRNAPQIELAIPPAQTVSKLEVRDPTPVYETSNDLKGAWILPNPGGGIIIITEEWQYAPPADSAFIYRWLVPSTGENGVLGKYSRLPGVLPCAQPRQARVIRFSNDKWGYDEVLEFDGCDWKVIEKFFPPWIASRVERFRPRMFIYGSSGHPVVLAEGFWVGSFTIRPLTSFLEPKWEEYATLHKQAGGRWYDLASPCLSDVAVFPSSNFLFVPTLGFLPPFRLHDALLSVDIDP